MFTIRPYHKGEEKYVAELHKRIYFEEHNWGPEFSYYAGKIAADFAAQKHSADEEMWIAEKNGQPIGSIMLCHSEEEGAGQIRLFAVEKSERKNGVGSALISELMNKVKSSSYKKLVLYTAEPLKEAIKKYESLGFRETQRTPNTNWDLTGKTVYEIKMELELG